MDNQSDGHTGHEGKKTVSAKNFIGRNVRPLISEAVYLFNYFLSIKEYSAVTYVSTAEISLRFISIVEGGFHVTSAPRFSARKLQVLMICLYYQGHHSLFCGSICFGISLTKNCRTSNIKNNCAFFLCRIHSGHMCFV